MERIFAPEPTVCYWPSFVTYSYETRLLLGPRAFTGMVSRPPSGTAHSVVALLRVPAPVANLALGIGGRPRPRPCSRYGQICTCGAEGVGGCGWQRREGRKGLRKRVSECMASAATIDSSSKISSPFFLALCLPIARPSCFHSTHPALRARVYSNNSLSALHISTSCHSRISTPRAASPFPTTKTCKISTSTSHLSVVPFTCTSQCRSIGRAAAVIRTPCALQCREERDTCQLRMLQRVGSKRLLFQSAGRLIKNRCCST